MADNSVTIDVNVRMTIDKRTAENCLHLVQMYVNSHDFVSVVVDKEPNGDVIYRLVHHYD